MTLFEHTESFVFPEFTLLDALVPVIATKGKFTADFSVEPVSGLVIENADPDFVPTVLAYDFFLAFDVVELVEPPGGSGLEVLWVAFPVDLHLRSFVPYGSLVGGVYPDKYPGIPLAFPLQAEFEVFECFLGVDIPSAFTSKGEGSLDRLPL